MIADIRVRRALRSLRTAISKFEASGDSKDYTAALWVMQGDKFYPERFGVQSGMGALSDHEHARWAGVRAAGRWLLLEAMQRRRDQLTADLAEANAKCREARRNSPTWAER